MIQATDRADDALDQLVLAQFQLAEILARPVIVVQGRQQIGIAIGEIVKDAGMAVKGTKAAVCAALDADLVPQPRRAEQVGDRQHGTVEPVPGAI